MVAQGLDMGRRFCVCGFCRSIEMLNDVVQDTVLEQGGKVNFPLFHFSLFATFHFIYEARAGLGGFHSAAAWVAAFFLAPLCGFSLKAKSMDVLVDGLYHQVVVAEKGSTGGLQEKLSMTVAMPLLWGVPPAVDTLHYAIRSGGGIVERTYRCWEFLWCIQSHHPPPIAPSLLPRIVATMFQAHVCIWLLTWLVCIYVCIQPVVDFLQITLQIVFVWSLSLSFLQEVNSITGVGKCCSFL